jgi:Secretion system C-terminal sorting domain/Photosynthesis system II assembly factor YCF48
MKRLLYILFIIPLTVSSQGWFIQTTFNPAQSLQAVRFWDANTGYTTAPLYNASNFCIHKTTNAGVNWTDQNSGFTSMRFMGIWIVHPDTVYMSGNSGIIIKTVNGGSNWAQQNTNDNSTQFWGLQFVNSLTGYSAGSNGKIIKTTDAGTTWSVLNSGVPNALSCIHFRNENTGYVSGSSIMIKTTNAGASWSALSAPYIAFENIRDISFTSDMNGIAVSDAGRVLKTTSAGVNWTLIPSGTGQSLFGLFFTDPNTAFACGNAGAIIRTTDGGSSWTGQTSPLSEILTDVWFTSTNTGYISSWSGKILKTTNGGVTFVNQISSEIPDAYLLEQNYPNPFNPITRLKFQMPKSEFADLRVFDVTGKEIISLVNEELKPGIYEIDWDASNYPSGIYFYTLSTDHYRATKRMILVK